MIYTEIVLIKFMNLMYSLTYKFGYYLTITLYRPSAYLVVKKYSFGFVLRRLAILISMDKIQEKCSFRMRLVGLISRQKDKRKRQKNFFFGHHYFLHSANDWNLIPIQKQITFILKWGKFLPLSLLVLVPWQIPQPRVNYNKNLRKSGLHSYIETYDSLEH